MFIFALHSNICIALIVFVVVVVVVLVICHCLCLSTKVFSSSKTNTQNGITAGSERGNESERFWKQLLWLPDFDGFIGKLREYGIYRGTVKKKISEAVYSVDEEAL